VYSPKGINQGKQLRDQLSKADIRSKSFASQLLTEPTQIHTKQGTPFKVFTPFWRRSQTLINVHPPEDAPTLLGVDLKLESESLESWQLLPTKPDWSTGLKQRWHPGEEGAQLRWHNFIEGGAQNYSDSRDFPSQHKTSYLSPHLTFGEISANQIWFETQEALANNRISAADATKFLAEIGWREFSRYLIVNFPYMLEQPFNQRFDKFPWQHNEVLLKAWQQGKTGYPIVDAGMQELWETGYMHNRVRMITASFLTKHCLIHWRHGMDWFWDTLVDADIASNTASWQWVSGSGADAAPYFRIFNPILQGEKFDKDGEYIRRWLPVLKDLPAKYINKPWLADDITLQEAGIELGVNYPHPIVDHRDAREKALSAYQNLRLLNS